MFKIIFYLLKHIVGVIKHLLIGKSENVVSLALKELGPHLIILFLLPFGMVGSIHFYDQAFFAGQKVNNVITYDVLSQKLYAQSLTTYAFP